MATALNIVGLVVEGVKRTIEMAIKAMKAFSTVNAAMAIASEKWTLFFQGVNVILGDALEPMLVSLADLLKTVYAAILPPLVAAIEFLVPAVTALIETIAMVIDRADLFGQDTIRPLDVEEQGLRRAASGVASMLHQFASAGRRPTEKQVVVVNYHADPEAFDGLLTEALVIGDNIVPRRPGMRRRRPESAFSCWGRPMPPW